MHEPIKDSLEDYLLGKLGNGLLRDCEAHLRACAGCREEVERMREQSLMLKRLRAPEGIEPAVGFYARVLNNIESQSKPSIWSVFLDPVFGKRLMYATMTLLVLLSTYLVTTQPETAMYADTAASPEKILVEERPSVGADQQRDRDVVLVNLATYRD